MLVYRKSWFLLDRRYLLISEEESGWGSPVWTTPMSRWLFVYGPWIGEVSDDGLLRWKLMRIVVIDSRIDVMQGPLALSAWIKLTNFPGRGYQSDALPFSGMSFCTGKSVARLLCMIPFRCVVTGLLLEMLVEDAFSFLPSDAGAGGILASSVTERLWRAVQQKTCSLVWLNGDRSSVSVNHSGASVHRSIKRFLGTRSCNWHCCLIMFTPSAVL